MLQLTAAWMRSRLSANSNGGSHMDWIQIYFIVMQILGFGAVCHYHGRPRDRWSVFDYFISLGLCAPFYGRILGWW